MAIRKTTPGSDKEKKDPISWRGHEVTRIEAFSDAVFAFAITLLVVSLEVPKNFEELLEAMKGFIPFAISFVMFFQIWTAQNLYFRRYGLHDDFTLAISACLLFSVLFFVYPMKFLWTMLFHNHVVISSILQTCQLFYIYGSGFTAVYLIFGIMYWHALRRRDHLHLSPAEMFETKTYAYRHFATAGVGIISMLFATMALLSPALQGVGIACAGMSYALVGAAVGLTHSRRGKIRRAVHNDFVQEKTYEQEPAGEAIMTE